MRCLWPSLGSTVASACYWGKDEAAKQPILAIALGLTLWPAAIITATVGTPIVLVDGVVQKLYDNLLECLIGEQIERGAAKVYYARRLSFVCAKLVLHQTSRVASCQINDVAGL
eukprot:8359470-Ditylum_brightwellii.AAC.1